MTSISLWEKIELSVQELARASQEEGSEHPEEETENSTQTPPKNWKLRFRIADAIAAMLWIGAFVKLAIFDFDRYIVDQTFPDLAFLLTFRFLLLLVALAVFIALRKKNVFWLIYTTLFPLVFLMWKVPAFFYRRRSKVLALSVINGIYNLGAHFRRSFLIAAIELTCLTVAFAGSPNILRAATISLLGILISLQYVSSILMALRSSRFIKRQQGLVRRLTTSDAIQNQMSIQRHLRDNESELFDRERLNLIANSISMGLLIWKGIGVYSKVLEEYRKSSAGIVLGMFCFARLFVRSLIVLTAINYALYGIDPQEFNVDSQPSIIKFAYYSLASLYANGVPGLEPTGEIATIVSLIAGIYGPLLLMALALQIWFGFKQSRDEVSYQETLQVINRERRALVLRLEQEYELSTEEVFQRMQAYGLGFIDLIVYLSTLTSEEND